MSDQVSKGKDRNPEIAEAISELARRLHEAEHLAPEVRAEAADLLDELSRELRQSSSQSEDLAESTAQFVRAVKDQHEPGLVEAAWDRVEKAVAKAETTSPLATDLVRRLIDALTGIGI